MGLKNIKYIDMSEYLDKNKYEKINEYIYQRIQEYKDNKLNVLAKSYIKSVLPELKINKSKSDNITLNKKSFTTKENNHVDNGLNIRFIDCNKADAIVIENKGKYAVIDFGRAKNQVFDYLKTTDCKKIDFALVTHCHEDHIQDIANISKKYNIENFVTFNKYAYTKQSDISYNNIRKVSNIEANNKAYLDEKVIKQSKLEPFQLGDAKFTFLSPTELQEDLNGNSLVLLLEYNNFKVLLTGDMTKNAERQLLDYCLYKNIDLSNVNILKLAHHGSNYSSSDEFLEEFKKDLTIPVISGDGINIDETKEKIDKYFDYHFTTYENGDISVNVPANQNEIYTVTCTQDGREVTSTFTIEDYIKEGVFEDNQSKKLDEDYNKFKEENNTVMNIEDEQIANDRVIM